MILDRVVLHDFGVYSGRQEIDLAPPAHGQPVVLFEGLNGAGKTTLMDALQLCLFGAAAKYEAQEGEGYGKFISRSINKHSRWGQASVSLTFRRTENGKEARYRVERTWKKTAGGAREFLEVSRDKRVEKSLAENWPQLVEEILPANIAHLFFFDGEKVETYASPEGARKLVTTGVKNLLGMDVIERLQKDLLVVERRRQRAEMSPQNLERIQAKEKELKALQDTIRQLTEDKAAKYSRGLDVAKRNLAKLEDEYKNRGGEARDKQKEIYARAAVSDEKLAANHARMAELADGMLPLALIDNLLCATAKQAEKELEIKQAQAVTAALRERDASMFSVVQKTPEAAKILPALKDFCAADIKTREKSARRETPLQMSAEALAMLRSFLEDKKPALLASGEGLLEEREKLQDEAEAAQMEKAAIPPEDAIAAIVARRESLQADIARMEAEIGEMERLLAQHRATANALESEIRTLWEKNAEAELENKKSARFVKKSRQARKTLSDFQSAVLRRQVGRVSRLALESYQTLLRKDGLVSELQINPESFDILLLDNERDELSPEQLSAGERQLLAVSLLWGMAKASGRALPVAIDTPMGRLDSEHRRRLVERYFPHVSHQTLLFSTDEEISGEYLRMLRPHIGRFYRLDYDDSTKATTVKKGDL